MIVIPAKGRIQYSQVWCLDTSFSRNDSMIDAVTFALAYDAGEYGGR
jgi:hypothetical protein